MKKLIIGLILVILLVPVSCAPPVPAPAPIPSPGIELPPPEPAPVPEPEPTPMPAPAPEPAPPPKLAPTPKPEPQPVEVTQPLTYEVLKSFIEKDTYKERRRMTIGGQVIQDEVVTVTFPIGCVAVKNTASVSGTFTVHFVFYSLDKLSAQTHKEAFGKIDEGLIKMVGREYSRDVVLTLGSDEMETARYTVRDISLDEDEWLWEFEITPSTKTVTIQK